MSNNRERIMRDLEYLSGGITAIKSVCNEERDARFYRLLGEWQDTIYSIIDMIEEDYEECQEHSKNSPW